MEAPFKSGKTNNKKLVFITTTNRKRTNGIRSEKAKFLKCLNRADNDADRPMINNSKAKRVVANGKRSKTSLL